MTIHLILFKLEIFFCSAVAHCAELPFVYFLSGANKVYLMWVGRWLKLCIGCFYRHHGALKKRSDKSEWVNGLQKLEPGRAESSGRGVFRVTRNWNPNPESWDCICFLNTNRELLPEKMSLTGNTFKQQRETLMFLPSQSHIWIQNSSLLGALSRLVQSVNSPGCFEC